MTTLSNNPLKKNLCWIGALAVILVAGACKLPQTTANLDNAPKLIEISKGPCYGPCPVYKLTVYRGGLATYEGERFTEKEGMHTKTLTTDQLDKLQAECQRANLWQYPDAFRSQHPDLPTVTIVYYEEDNNNFKSILGKEGRPEAVMAIEAMLDKIADSGGWISKNKTPAGGNGSENTTSEKKNEIIVQLMEGVDGAVWARQYNKYNLQVIKRLSPRSFYWLVTFDDKKIAPQAMLEAIQKDDYVVAAEFNRSVEWRK